LSPMADEAPSADGSLVRVHVRERKGSIVEAVRRLSDAGVGVDDLALRRPTLDDVFLALTGHAAEDVDGDASDSGSDSRAGSGPVGGSSSRAGSESGSRAGSGSGSGPGAESGS
jgi:hypothetical protein